MKFTLYSSLKKVLFKVFRKEVIMDENKKPGNAFSRTVYKGTHYRSYHSYMGALHRLHYFVFGIVIIAIATLFSFGKASNMLVNMTLVLMMLYFFMYYWVNAKGSRMKKDSKEIMRQVSLNGYIARSWNVYDGIFRSNSEDLSLELSFARENPFIVNIFNLFISKKKATLPMDLDDIISLRHYVHDLEELKETRDTVVIVYATMNEEIAKHLREKNFILNELPSHYITRPFISDMAVAYKDKKILTKFRSQNYKAYRISVDPDTYQDQLREEIKKSDEQHRKENK